MVRAYCGNLNVGYGDVEEIVHVGEPDHPHVRHDHCTQVPLIARGWKQRVLNAFWRTRLSRRRIFGSYPTLASTPPSVSSTGSTNRKTETERQLAEGREGGWGEEGVKSYDGEKAWSSKHPLVLSGSNKEEIIKDDICVAAFN